MSEQELKTGAELLDDFFRVLRQNSEIDEELRKAIVDLRQQQKHSSKNKR